MKYQSLLYFVASIAMKRAGGPVNCKNCRVLNPDPDPDPDSYRDYRDYREADSPEIEKQQCRVLNPDGYREADSPEIEKQQCRVLNPDPDPDSFRDYRGYREADSPEIEKQQCRVLKLADKPSCLEGGDQGINAG